MNNSQNPFAPRFEEMAQYNGNSGQYQQPSSQQGGNGSYLLPGLGSSWSNRANSTGSSIGSGNGIQFTGGYRPAAPTFASPQDPQYAYSTAASICGPMNPEHVGVEDEDGDTVYLEVCSLTTTTTATSVRSRMNRRRKQIREQAQLDAVPRTTGLASLSRRFKPADRPLYGSAFHVSVVSVPTPCKPRANSRPQGSGANKKVARKNDGAAKTVRRAARRQARHDVVLHCGELVSLESPRLSPMPSPGMMPVLVELPSSVTTTSGGNRQYLQQQQQYQQQQQGYFPDEEFDDGFMEALMI